MSGTNIVFLDFGTVGDDLHMPNFAGLGEVSMYKSSSSEEVRERIKDADIVLTNKANITADHIASAPRLKYIGTIATGYNQVDIKAAAARGIPVCNVPSYSTPSVVQHTFALIFGLAAHLCTHTRAVAEGEWSKSQHFCFWKAPVVEMSGKTIGIVGFGDIGHSVGLVAHQLGMHVLAYAPRPKAAPVYSPFAFTSLPELFAESDVVTLHCPLTPENTGMVNSLLLSSMKKSALFINCARGPLVNEQDLAKALNDGIIAGAGLDVVTEEPMLDSNPLRTAKNCMITPHIAWASLEARNRLIQGAYDNVKNFLAGQPSNVRNGVVLPFKSS